MDSLVITGYGVKCNNGYNKQHFKESLEQGRFDLSYFQSTSGSQVVVGRVPDEELGEFQKSRYSRVTKLGLAATKEAIEMANIPRDPTLRITVIFASAAGPTEETVLTNERCFNQNFKKYPLLGIGLMSYHSIASAVIGEFQVGSKAFTAVSGCNSSSDALYIAKILLDSNQTDICIVGGADAPICEPVLYGFEKLRISETNTCIEEAGVPFSNRDKFVIAEGAGVLIIEKESTADSRKATKYGTLIDVDTINDGLSAYISDKTGTKMIDVVKSVTDGKTPTYINSQALGLINNDSIEMKVRDTIFHNSIPITSIKGVTGHPFGAAGILQIISSLLSIEYSFIPRVKVNDKTEDLDIVSETVYTDVHSVCITTHGFGGNSSCVLVGR